MGPLWARATHCLCLCRDVSMADRFDAAFFTNGGMSLLNQTHLLTKIYFPRSFVPTSVVGGALLRLCDLVNVRRRIDALVSRRAEHLDSGMPLLLLLTMVCSAAPLTCLRRSRSRIATFDS